MNNVKKYVDELFREFSNSKRAKTLKSKMLANMEKRYQELLEQDIEGSQVEKQLIDEIDTVEEIRKSINSNIKKEVIVFCIKIFIFIIAFGYSIYANINDHVFIADYNILPRKIAIIISNPIAIFGGTVLILTIIDYMIKPNNIFIQNKQIRFTLLIISIFLMGLYLLMIFSIVESILIFMKFSYFIYEQINIIAVVIGILYYLGSRKLH